jgi:hypothetical protein
MNCNTLCILLCAIALSTGGCCRSLPPQPSRPDKIEGWKDFVDAGMRFRGVLLLKKGESSDNGKIGVRVTDIAEAELCGDVGIEYHRRARLQFYTPSGGRVLCEELVADGGNSGIGCGDRLGVAVIGVRAINTAEGWVLFDLRY